MNAAKNLRKYLTAEELQEKVVDWSRDTLIRRIRNDGFPAIKDGKRWLIPIDEMELWFKRRKIQN